LCFSTSLPQIGGEEIITVMSLTEGMALLHEGSAMYQSAYGTRPVPESNNQILRRALREQTVPHE
jgi:hypothetical protein